MRALWLTIRAKPDPRMRSGSTSTKTTKEILVRKFGCTPERLKAAVTKVGVMAKDVEKELSRR
jgi:Protein of unknown function (DUF3606)